VSTPSGEIQAPSAGRRPWTLQHLIQAPERGARGRYPPWAWSCLAVVCTAGAALVVILGTRLTFFNDDWWFLLQRPGLESGAGLDTLLAPHNGNIVVLVALIYKVAVAIFGFGTQLPFRLLIGITLGILGVLVFVIVAERLGPIIGLAAAAVVVFLGPAWEAMLFLAPYSHLGTLTVGLGALLALEIDTPKRNVIALGLLLCATLLGNLGVAFIIGAAIAILLRRRWDQLWIPAVPAAVFAAWWAFYGSKHPSGITLHNIEHLPGYVWGSISMGMTTITGLNHGSNPLPRGHLLGVILGLVLVATLLMGHRPRPWILVFAGTALAFWILTGAGYMLGRSPGSSRYQIVDGVLLILFCAEWLHGVRLPRPAVAVVSAAALLVVVSNILSLGYGFDFMGTQSDYAKADLGALKIAGARAGPSLQLVASVAHNPYLSGVTASRYVAQTRAHGDLAVYTPAQLAAALPPQQQAADNVLAAADRIRAVPAKRHSGGCRRAAVATTQAAVALPRAAGAVWIRNPGATTLVISLSRFAPAQFAVPVGFVVARSTVRLEVPRDAVPKPWRLTVRNTAATGGATASVCTS
jgi:hypothetical protein